MKKIFLLVLFLAFSIGFGQNLNPADIDPSFNLFNLPLENYFIDNEVNKSYVLNDGRILVLFGNNKLVKLNGNLLDTSFSTGSGFNNPNNLVCIQDFIVQPNGKIIVSGNFSSVNGNTNKRFIVRLNEDGGIDNTFSLSGTNSFSNRGITKLVLQADGKIVFIADSGPLGSYNKNIYRLNSNGALDTTFSITPAIHFGTAEIQADGKFIVSHTPTTNAIENNVSRLNSDGSFDTSFTTLIVSMNIGYTPYIKKIFLQNDGKILIGGRFTGASATSRKDLVRLNNDGSLDTSFQVGSGFYQSSYYDDSIVNIMQQEDGKILASGYFVSYNGVNCKNIVRLNIDGSLDSTFINTTNAQNILALFDDGRILVQTNRYERRYDAFIGIINQNGTKDATFNNICKGFFTLQGGVKVVKELSDGKLLVGGGFSKYNGAQCYSFTRLNSDGSLDESMNYGGLGGFSQAPFGEEVNAIAQLPNGKIYLAGNFANYNGVAVNKIIRINNDGTLDTTFNISNYSFGDMNNVSLLPTSNGLLVKGNFQNNLIRFSDTGYYFGYLDDVYGVSTMELQNDGKLIVGGYYDIKRYINSFPVESNRDNSFNLDPLITNEIIKDIEIQNDGKILLLGNFTINGSISFIIRVLSNGTFDPTFNLNIPNQIFSVNSMTLLPDQKILLVCSQDSNNFIERFLRINNNGSIDNAFADQMNVNNLGGRVHSNSLTSGKILFFGSFSTYQGLIEYGIVRLMGENYYFIEGQNRLDINNNGCDNNDTVYSSLKFQITNPSNSFDFFANTTGEYFIATNSGNYTITPTFENPSYFTATPTSISVSFPSQASPVIQDFCITPNGLHPDLEITLLPLTVARPGFEAKYRLVYKNKGNQLQSGTVNFNFNDAVLNFVTATTAVSSQTLNNLNWNFNNLMPLETREITITLNVNSPTSTPPVTSGFVLNYTTSVSSTLTDEMPSDNTFTFNQTVVNSFDPNDKTCLEGASIATTKVGDYVHYMIRFENTGSYNAQNITVKDVIDTAKYDINTLLPTSGSHSFITRILEGNRAEFYFENIDLPFADATNDGYVAFKIKTKSTLVAGDSFSNSAGIYFDYNYPITTNTATTTITALSSQDFTFNDYFSVYPNPVENNLNISKKEEIEISSITIYNMLGQIVVAIPNAKNIETVDVSSLKSGNYFVKINSNRGNSNTKFIKL